MTGTAPESDAGSNGSYPKLDIHSRVFLDDAFFGVCGGWTQPARRVRAGRHHVEVQSDDSGRRDWQGFSVREDADVAIPLGYDREPDARLIPQPRHQARRSACAFDYAASSWLAAT